MAASQLWGYGNPGELYCAIAPADNACQPVNANVNWNTQAPAASTSLTAMNMIKAVADKVYAGNLTASSRPIDGKHIYLYYFHAFTTGCGAVEDTNASGNTAYTATLVGSDGKASEKKYRGADHNTKKYVYRSGDGAIEKTCLEIANELKTWAPAFADYAKTNPDTIPKISTTTTGGLGNNDGSETEESSCVVDGIGWILCPAMRALAGMADASYSFLANNFLEIDRDLLNQNPSKVSSKGVPVGTGTYDAWRVMQSIANVAFVIAFIVIIYSQLTSAGISNYGVKRLLPRIIIAAILVNTSFLICQVAVDLSNILGYGLKNMFNAIDIASGSYAGNPAANTKFDFLSLVGDLMTGAAVAGAVAISVWLAIPGGTVEPTDATLEDALQRECLEEVGITVDNIRSITNDIHDKGEKGALYIVYEASYASGEVKPLDGTADAQWLTIEQVRELELTPKTLEIIEKCL